LSGRAKKHGILFSLLILVILPSHALSAVERWWKFLTVGLSVHVVMRTIVTLLL